MTTRITLTCPECGKNMKAPAEAVGKKVRCGQCDKTFLAKGSPATAAAGKKAQPAKKTKPAAKPVDDDDDGKPYDLTETRLTARCPDCANEMESEDAIVCLHCGYNTRTRERSSVRKVRHNTGFDWTLWLLPGILCLLLVLSLLGFDIWYCTQIDNLVDTDTILGAIAAHRGIKMWIVIMTLFVMYFAGKFAFRRLILHPRPPEVEEKFGEKKK